MKDSKLETKQKLLNSKPISINLEDPYYTEDIKFTKSDGIDIWCQAFYETLMILFHREAEFRSERMGFFQKLKGSKSKII